MNTQELNSNYLFNKRFVVELSENELANIEGGTTPACIWALTEGLLMGGGLVALALYDGH